jgi:hypothetical protein
MNKKLKTNEAPNGYISISEAAEILGICPFDLRLLMESHKRSVHTASTLNRRLWILGEDVRRFEEWNPKGRPKKSDS